MSARIRDETPGDFSAIDAVNLAAFATEPHSDHTEQAIVRALRASGALAVSLVAELDGRVVGYVAMSPVSISDGAEHWYGLGPVAVSPEHQGKGVGQMLVQEALRRLQHRGAAGCVVLGEPRFYSKFGFERDAALVLPEVPPEYFQALRFSGPPPRGVVAYHESFGVSARP